MSNKLNSSTFGLSFFAFLMLGIAGAGVPVVERMHNDPTFFQRDWPAPQQNAWNPYDCLFWADLPPVEFLPE